MERESKRGRRGPVVVAGVGVVLLAAWGGASAQTPRTPPAAPKAEATAEAKKDAPRTVAVSKGPIRVESTVDDSAVEHTLEELLPKYPGVRSVDATVEQGVVTLDGRVDDDDTRNQMTEVAQKVEGVRLVINRLATDAEVMTAPELVWRKLTAIADVVRRRWLLAVLALAIVMLFSWAARLFNTYAETLLAPFVSNPMLRSVFGSLVGTLLILGGLIFGLSVLNLTHAVASVLGVAGVVGLAVGFAFKDITENFIASVLLGVRRPFRVGDYVTVAGQTGVVKSLNTRATVLVTLEGNHVRIPNNVVYKEILVNATASPTYRANFDVVVPYEASTAAATEAITRALRGVGGVVADPPARALVEALEPAGVRVRAYYWVPVQGVDWYKLHSDAKLAAKVALQRAGVLGPPPPAGGDGDSGDPDPARSAAANLRRDARASEAACAAAPDGHGPAQRALHEAETRVSEEGTNLLAGAGKADG